MIQKKIIVSLFILVTGFLLFALCFVQISDNFSNKKDDGFTNYVDSAYILTPKNTAYSYRDPNTIVKIDKVDKVIIPANLSIGQTVLSNGTLLKKNTNKNNPFLIDTHDNSYTRLSFNTNLTMSTYPYQLTPVTNSTIEVAKFDHLYKFNDYVLPNKTSNDFSAMDDVAKYKPSLEYLNLSQFNISYQKKYNITKSKGNIYIGYIK